MRNAHLTSTMLTVILTAGFAFSAIAQRKTNEAASRKERVLFFVAHPDDTIACAGTMFLMKDRFELHVGVLTHGERGLGEKGYRDVSLHEVELDDFTHGRHVSQNKGDRMCALEMFDAEMRAQRCATFNVLGSARSKCVERFAQWDGKPQGSRCIFSELPPPKGWRQDWSAANGAL